MAIPFKTLEQLPAIKIKGRFSVPVTGISIDTRSLNAGDLFVAFIGTQVDGHDFIPKAISRGASAVMASTFWGGCETWDAPIPLIMTDDPVKTLADLATAHRHTFQLPVIAVTGTNGKTSTKNMIAHILGRRLKVLATQGNLNNHIGLPLTILQLDESFELAVIEMGASQAGDIDYLCHIAQPTQGLITNISLAHTEFFHDLETIQRTKGELFTYLGSTYGRAFVNMDDARVAELGAACPNPIQYGLNAGQETGFEISGPDTAGCYTLQVDGHSIRLSQPGKAFALNAMAAAAVALQNGVLYSQLKEALEDYPGEKGRMQREVIRGVTFFNDAYNANPASTQAGLETISAIPTAGTKIIVFGDMLELGPDSAMLHRQVGEQLLQAAPGFIILYGPESQAVADVLAKNGFTACFHTCDKGSAHSKLISLLQPGDLVYLKGSRGMALETFLQAYKELT